MRAIPSIVLRRRPLNMSLLRYSRIHVRQSHYSGSIAHSSPNNVSLPYDEIDIMPRQPFRTTGGIHDVIVDRWACAQMACIKFNSRLPVTLPNAVWSRYSLPWWLTQVYHQSANLPGRIVHSQSCFRPCRIILVTGFTEYVVVGGKAGSAVRCSLWLKAHVCTFGRVPSILT